MAILSTDLKTRLLGSIEVGNLVVICGAGLSIPTPSNLMTAAQVADRCYEKWRATEVLPAPLRYDVEKLATHFYETHQFESVFIDHLVPWNELVGEPNVGHAAVADMLICKAAVAALSGNFDPLIEQWAQRRKIAMRGARDGVEAAAPAAYNPLLKFHGCFSIDPKTTIWTREQLNEPIVSQRIESCIQWMNLHLPGKHLLIVGFWTDWDYLNDTIERIAGANGISAITVVNMLPEAALQARAPNLWAQLKAASLLFHLVEASAEATLDELRLLFSEVWARKFFRLAKTALEAEGSPYPEEIEIATWESNDVYELRLDAEGLPYNRAAVLKEPAAEASVAALAHLLLVNAKAGRRRAWYTHHGQLIRVIHGAGQPISAIQEKYNEPPAGDQPDIIICAGAFRLGTPGRIIASGSGSSVIRPRHGGLTRWLTFEEARMELAI